MLRYPWPASRLDRDLMARLHAVRERTQPRRPITLLIAEAVREKVQNQLTIHPSTEPKEAA
jgi:hypothetical protein